MAKSQCPVYNGFSIILKYMPDAKMITDCDGLYIIADGVTLNDIIKNGAKNKATVHKNRGLVRYSSFYWVSSTAKHGLTVPPIARSITVAALFFILPLIFSPRR